MSKDIGHVTVPPRAVGQCPWPGCMLLLAGDPTGKYVLQVYWIILTQNHDSSVICLLYTGMLIANSYITHHTILRF